MIETEIKDLLGKYIEDNLTSEEKRRFLFLVASPENESAFKEIILSMIEEEQDDNVIGSSTDFEKIYYRILSEVNLSGTGVGSKKSLRYRLRRNRIILSTVGIAASLIIAFLLGGLFLHTRPSVSPGQDAIATYTEIKSPFGSTSEILLPDGSQVLLNAGSSLKYQNNYNKANRDLYLTGEAYFKVSKNPDLPLTVSAGNLNIRAVGTEFNVKAYTDEPVIETTLVEGRVEIIQIGREEAEDEYLDLRPNQTAIFRKETESFTLEGGMKRDTSLSVPVKTLFENILISPKVDVNEVAAWTQGKLIIKGENLEDLCVKLQRKYDVTFTFGDEEVRNFRFTGILLDETLEQVMAAIQLAAPIRYSITGKSVLMGTDKSRSDYYSEHLK